MRDHRTTWERYVQAWRAPLEAEKRRLYDGCLALDFVYTDPLTVATGWDQLTAYMLDFQRQVPGGHFVTEEFFDHHGRSGARWRMVAGDGKQLGNGISFAEYDERGMLRAVTGFFETTATSAA